MVVVLERFDSCVMHGGHIVQDKVDRATECENLCLSTDNDIEFRLAQRDQSSGEQQIQAS